MNKAKKPYVKRQRPPTLSPRQEKVMSIIRRAFGESMDCETKHLKLVAAEMGYKHHGAIRDILFSLRDKGHMQSVGGPISKPQSWRLLPERDATVPQHIHSSY